MDIISRNKDIIFIYINCSTHNTFGSIVKKIISTLKKVLYNEQGKGRGSLTDDLIKTISSKARKKGVVYIIDEIDKLLEKERDHQEILTPLLENTNSNVILISNKERALEKLETRIMSRLNPERYIVERYNAEETFQILLERAREGLKKGWYTTETLAKISRDCYQTTGDIRDALSVLFQAAQLAEERGIKLEKSIVDEATSKVQEMKLKESLVGLTKHQLIIVGGIAKLSLQERKGFAELNELYNFYVANLSSRDVAPVCKRQFEKLLDKIELKGLIKRKNAYLKGFQGRVCGIKLEYPEEEVYKLFYD